MGKTGRFNNLDSAVIISNIYILQLHMLLMMIVEFNLLKRLVLQVTVVFVFPLLASFIPYLLYSNMKFA